MKDKCKNCVYSKRSSWYELLYCENHDIWIGIDNIPRGTLGDCFKENTETDACPNPKCKSSKSRIMTVYLDGAAYFAVECSACFIRGPVQIARRDAIVEWNSLKR